MPLWEAVSSSPRWSPSTPSCSPGARSGPCSSRPPPRRKDPRVKHWLDLGTAHYEAMGVEPVPLAVLDRDDAERADLAAQVDGAGLVYLSGGNPGYLARTLAGTAVWRAILEAWRRGAALAGCSAGACALSRVAYDFRHPDRYGGEGLSVVPGLVVIPHFDRFEHRLPGLVDEVLARTPPDAVLVGIDENTALLASGDSRGDGGRGDASGDSRGGGYLVRGEKSVWQIAPDGVRVQFRPGERASFVVPAPN